MKAQAKDLPVGEVRRYLEPGPIVLVSSPWKGKTNIMTMGWHMIMEFEPSLVGCYIWSENHSRDMVRKSGECVINVPTVDMAPKVVGIGNCSGREIDKFAKFGLTPVKGAKVTAPLIWSATPTSNAGSTTPASIDKYSLFVLEVVKAHVANRRGSRAPCTIAATACS